MKTIQGVLNANISVVLVVLVVVLVVGGVVVVNLFS